MEELERTLLSSGGASLRDDDDASAASMSVTAPHDASRERHGHEPGARIGRYIVLERLGAGGMGVVYAAIDPELGRRVAIKLLHPRLVQRGRERGADARSRLLREAQAMARLTHPNVITVHDVGTAGAEVFIAMEFVDGVSLAGWLEQRARTWREIAGVFRDAARGLAAAHDAGLVHRDFKPENLMIGVDGRVRVLDFGIARDRDDAPEPASSQLSSIADAQLRETLSSQISHHSQDLTRTGALMGTPAYMSPEQHMGIGASAASDQFSLCVALYEALYGQRPFAGDNPMQLAIAVLDGSLRPPPKGARAPSYLFHAVLARGLAVEPAERFPSMRELIAALSVDPVQRRRRRWIAGGLTLTLIAGAGGYAQHRRALAARCALAAAEIDAAWTDASRERIAAAFERDGREFALESLPRVEQTLADYVEGWRAGVASSCRATLLEGAQTEEEHVLRRRCYTHHLEEFAALVEILRDASGSEIIMGLDAAVELGATDQCEQLEALRAANQSLEDPERLAAVEAMRARFARVHALRISGRDDEEALRALEALAADAEALAYPPLLAEVQAELGDRLIEAEPERGAALYRSSLEHAIASGQDRLAAWICLHMALMHFLVKDLSEADFWVSQGLAWTQRLSRSTYLEGELMMARAGVYSTQARYEEARAAGERGLQKIEEAFGAEHRNYALALTRTATIEWRAGKRERERAQRERALELLESIYGSSHPELADSLHNLGVTELQEENFERAEALVRRGLELRRERFGPRSRLYAESLLTVAELQSKAGRYDEAIATNERVLEIFREYYGEGHTQVAVAHNNLGTALSAAGRGEEALEHLERALELRSRDKVFAQMVVPLYNLADLYRQLAEERRCRGESDEAASLFTRSVERNRRALELSVEHYGEEHYFTGVILSGLGVALRNTGEYAEAEQLQRRSIASLDRGVGPEHSTLAFPLVELGRLLLRRGQAAEALEPLERALELRTREDVDPGELAIVRLQLARALWDSGGDKRRAHDLAREAHAHYERDPPPDACFESRDWLAAHPEP